MELTSEQQEVLSGLGTWEAPHVPSWPRGKLVVALATALLARQRNRRRLRAALKDRRAWRAVCKWMNGHLTAWSDLHYDVSVKLGNRRRWAAAWKAAAKQWRRRAAEFLGKSSKAIVVIADLITERDELRAELAALRGEEE